MNDLDAIQADVSQRGITRLCHFTRSQKLAHMLAQTQAILPTQELRDRYPDLLDVTDTQRLDGHPGLYLLFNRVPQHVVF